MLCITIFQKKLFDGSCEALKIERLVELIVNASINLRRCCKSMGRNAKLVIASILLELPSPMRNLAMRMTIIDGTSHLIIPPKNPPKKMRGINLFLSTSEFICESCALC
jgi:hypothetical protein